MPIYHMLPLLAAGAFILAGVQAIVRAGLASSRQAWIIPATLALIFLAWSLNAVLREGPLGFWSEHVRNAWGNQIWFDLLLGVGTGFALLAARARRVGMSLLPWFVAIVCTGSVGLLAMASRYLYLDARREGSSDVA